MSEIKNSKPVSCMMHHDSVFNTGVTEVSQSLCGHMTVSQLLWLKVSFCREERSGNDFLLCSLIQIQQ